MADFLFRSQIKTHFQKALSTFTAQGVGFPGQSCKPLKKKKKKKMEGGYGPRNAGGLQKLEKGKKTDLYLEPTERNKPFGHPEFTPVRYILDF